MAKKRKQTRAQKKAQDRFKKVVKEAKKIHKGNIKWQTAMKMASKKVRK